MLLELAAVDYAFGSTPVLRAVSACASAGEIICVVGVNGAGKTTLLRLAAGLLAPTSGQVRLFGAAPSTTPRPALARRVAYLPQSYQLAFPFRVGEVVLMGRYPHATGLLGLESAADVAAARAAMERCDVLALAERRWSELSGGEQRRALLAQALCQNTELVLLDEPTAALDPGHALAFADALSAECARGLCAIVVTHDLNLALRCASRLWVLSGGALTCDGAPDEALTSGALEAAFALKFHSGILPGAGRRFAVPA